MPFRLTPAALAAMVARAEAEFPEETCGFIFRDGDLLEVRPMENIQNRLHREDPKTHPRDARTAYYFEPREMLRVIDQNEKAGNPLCAIYHSHPDHDAYFSETDSAAAAPLGEPSLPGVVFLVLSVLGGKFAGLKAFDWLETESRYVEVPLEA